MSKENKVVKSVAFNKKNPEEKQLLDSVKRKNFSKYIKKLMLEDYIRVVNEKAEQAMKEQLNNSYTQPQQIETYSQTHQNSPVLSPSEQLSQLKQRKDWQ